MSYKAMQRRLLFYTNWYTSMSGAERKSYACKWVLERINIFSGMLKNMDKEISGRKDGFNHTQK